MVDPETEKICGPNQNGELRVKSDFTMNGYFGRDSSESYDEEGWLKTGDIVYYDEDEFLFVVDRIKDLLKYRSWHVAPAMLEKVLKTKQKCLRHSISGFSQLYVLTDRLVLNSYSSG